MNNLNNIILIGPLATGKSTIAEHLSNTLKIKNYPVDKLKWYYRFKNGYDISKSTEILRTQGFDGLIGYAKQFFGPKELDRILHEFTGIIDLGATDTHCIDLSVFEEMSKTLEPFPNVFLILPYPDDKLSTDVLNRRLRLRYALDPLKGPVMNSYIQMNAEYVRSAHNIALAKHVIYTNDRPYHEIVQEIIYRSDLGQHTANQLHKVV